MAVRRSSPRSRAGLTASVVGFVLVACLVPPGAGSTPSAVTAVAGPTAGIAEAATSSATPSVATPVADLLPVSVDAPVADQLGERVRLTRPTPPAAVGARPLRARRPPAGTARTTASPRPRAAAGVDCRKRKCIALTFDDGPVAGTSGLLDVLRRRGARATFFVVGQNAAAHPGLLRRMVREGHVVANHSLDHVDLSRLGAADVRRELVATNRIIRRATGSTPTLVRPPYGATDGTVASVARRLGMAQVLWDVDPVDWKDHDASLVRRRVLARAHRGAIVLSHDLQPATRAAYARIIDTLLARGYTLVTVPELLGRPPRPGRTYSHG